VQAARGCRGVGLIEVLISLVIISIGLLGLAGLQMGSMQKLQQARYQNALTTALDDLSGRIIANKSLAKSGYFTFSTLNGESAPTKDSSCIAAKNCNDSQTALNELAIWYQTAAATLPSLRFAVATTLNSSTSSARMTINLTWDAELTGTGSADCSGNDGHACARSQLWLY